MGSSSTRRRIVGWFGALTVGALLGGLPLLGSAEAAPTASRISGANRFETAANISAASFSPGVNTAYIATGHNFPDALAAAPAAAKAGAPVLLTEHDTLPAATAAELDRLDPMNIVVLGGTGAVSDAVFTALDPYTQGQVARISGNNRFETAASLSNAIFTTVPVNTVFVATGFNFPDALAGGPAAAIAPSGGGPILLVEEGSIPQATATELQRLGAQKVVVLGGAGAVSDAVVAALDPYSVDPVVRRSGADRFLTSVAISFNHFGSATKVYLATGVNFPDALAGGPPAGIAAAPVLLTQPTCIPPEVNNEITRLNPEQLIVLGGSGAVSDAVLSRTVCQPPTTTSTTAGGNCTPGYSQCLTPNIGDYDCAGGSGNGPNYVTGPILVTGDDPYDLDGTPEDGVGCENG